jgi:arylsulfatase A-like enzyme
MVDQLRAPAWFSDLTLRSRLTPNLARLRQGAVSFDAHHTAANSCTPARSTLLTGLYTHQTGCMITSGSTLEPGFPTWGTILRELGYETWWYGKWHLTHGDNHWSLPADSGALERYGFSGGTYPSPDGGPGQGWRVDPSIARQFERWIAKASSREPWCTTVSFVNPHDIAWWYRWSDRFAAEASAPRAAHSLPPNFETPEQLIARKKPRLQLSHQSTSAVSFGDVPFTGSGVSEAWLPFLDLYLKLVRQVDRRVGEVMQALHSRPEIAENTVVIFTADHGEYGASHGLRGKGGGVYEECLRVPLLVKDLRRDAITRAHAIPRRALTSSVDIAPLLVDLATGENAWRRDSHYAHLAHRHDMLGMLRDPSAPGRNHILHATDEIVTEYAVRLYAANSPLHVAAIKTPKGKLALYSDWAPHEIQPLQAGQEGELYDYRTSSGRLELDNLLDAGSGLEDELRAKLSKASRLELREPLPQRLRHAQQAGFHDYFHVASSAAVKATDRRAKLLERLDQGHILGGGLRKMLRLQRRSSESSPA